MSAYVSPEHGTILSAVLPMFLYWGCLHVYKWKQYLITSYSVLRCSCIWPLCHGTHHRHPPANDRISHPLLSHGVQTELHHPKRQLWAESLHHGGYLLRGQPCSHQPGQVRKLLRRFLCTLKCTLKYRGSKFLLNSRLDAARSHQRLKNNICERWCNSCRALSMTLICCCTLKNCDKTLHK